MAPPPPPPPPPAAAAVAAAALQRLLLGNQILHGIPVLVPVRVVVVLVDHLGQGVQHETVSNEVGSHVPDVPNVPEAFVHELAFVEVASRLYLHGALILYVCRHCFETVWVQCGEKLCARSGVNINCTCKHIVHANTGTCRQCSFGSLHC